MRFAMAVAILIGFSGLALAEFVEDSDQEIVFMQASELLPWCQAEVEAYYTDRGISTYQQTTRYFERGGTFHVVGRVRAAGRDVPFTCRVSRGLSERYVIIEIDEEDGGIDDEP